MRYQGMMITVMAFAVFLASCSDNKKAGALQKTKSPPAIFGKMLGKWQNTGNNSIEQWAQTGDSIFSSVVFTINGADTSRTEEAIVYTEQGKWIFENKVKGQNEGKAVRFVSTILTDSEIQFSNPAHDFPTDIHYTIKGASGIQAFITGPGKNGRKDTVYFTYNRLNE